MIDLYGSTYVADVLGINRSAFTNQLARNLESLPQPAAVLRETVGRHKSHPRYLWDDNGLAEWRAWKANRDGKRDETLQAKADRLRAELAAVESKMNGAM